MFSSGISKSFVIFVLVSMFVDLKCALRMKGRKQYNKFELQSGTYADLAFLLTLVIVTLNFLTFNVSGKIITIIANCILALVYCGMFKVILQSLIRTKYDWVDTYKEKKDLRKVNRKRFWLIISYLLFLLFFRNLVLTLDKGIAKNVISILGTILMSRKVSRACSKINNKLKTEDMNQI